MSLPPGQPAIVETVFFPLNSAEACQETLRDEGAGCAAGQAEAEELIARPCGAGRAWQGAGRLFAPEGCGARRLSASLNATSDDDVANVKY